MHRSLGLSLFNICTAFSACAVTVVDTVYTLVYTLDYTDGINRSFFKVKNNKKRELHFCNSLIFQWCQRESNQ